jgi:hypothetical protein
MRAALAFVLVAACSPDIQSGSYYCGDEEACPPGLSCDGATNICVAPAEATPFSCDKGNPLFPATCGAGQLESTGCVNTAGAHDTFTLVTDATCTMDFTAQITMPIAFMPLDVTVKDASGNTVASGAPCNVAHGGAVDVCASFSGGNGQSYTVDVAAAAGAPTCDGACAFNRYSLSVQVTRP